MNDPAERDRLRQRILAARDALPPLTRAAKSRRISEHLRALPAFATAPSVLIYVSFRSEVETLPLIRDCLARGVRVSVPRTLVRQGRLEACLLSDPDRDLIPGYCGILEPRQETMLLDPAEIAVVLVPGSVFDRQGGRLGYGGGYYDRFLAQDAPKAIRIGLGYALQVTDPLPLLAHDQRLDYLVTENGSGDCCT